MASGKRVKFSPNLDDLLGQCERRTDFLFRFTLSHPGMHTNPARMAQKVAAARRVALPMIFTQDQKNG